MASNVSFKDKDILINGVSTQRVALALQQSGLADQKVGEIVGWWLIGAIGDTRPAPFDFATDVQVSDPANDIGYARTFVHTDWVDGEDRVQASATPEELGFNARFHAIENEFDAIRDQFQHLGAGVREIRSDLVGVVRELKSKITALQNELYDLRQQAVATKPKDPSGFGVIGTVNVGEKSAYIAQTGNSFQLLEFAGTTLGQTAKVNPVVNPGAPFEAGTVSPGDMVQIVADLEDLVTTPSVQEVVERPGATIADLRTAVGGALLSTGVSVASILAPLPADAAVPGVAGTVTMLTGYLVGLLPAATVELTRQELVTDAGVRRRPPSEIGAASAEAVGLTHGVAGALARAGVDTTVAGISRLTAQDLTGTLLTAGVAASTDEVRQAVARTRIVSALGGR